MLTITVLVRFLVFFREWLILRRLELDLCQECEIRSAYSNSFKLLIVNKSPFSLNGHEDASLIKAADCAKI